MVIDDAFISDEVARLVHALRQPLSTLVLLADNLQQIDLPAVAMPLAQDIVEQIAEATAVARQISRLVE